MTFVVFSRNLEVLNGGTEVPKDLGTQQYASNVNKANCVHQQDYFHGYSNKKLFSTLRSDFTNVFVRNLIKKSIFSTKVLNSC